MADQLMDADYLELILNLVSSKWERPLEDFERDEWIRWLKPSTAAPADPRLVVEAIELAKTSRAHKDKRPTVAMFAGYYQRILKAHRPKPTPIDPELVDATPETTQTVLDECRAVLADAREVRESIDVARSKLLHEMARADINQGTLL